MDSPRSGAPPIGWTELIAGLAALVFGIAAAWALLVSVATAPRLAEAAAGADARRATEAAGSALSCASPPLGGLHLGTPRVYGNGAVRLDPVPVGVSPALGAQAAYTQVALAPPACQTEELLAYYSGGTAHADHVLAWVVISTNPCPAGRCVYLSPVAMDSSVTLDRAFFALPAR